jgi:beta-galactosidase
MGVATSASFFVGESVFDISVQRGFSFLRDWASMTDMNRFCCVAWMLLVAGTVAGASAPGLPRERSLNPGWRFFRGEARGAERPEFDDRAWRIVNLPHDWSIEDLPGRDQDNQFAVVSLVPGNWRFSVGDNPEWSKSGFEDSGWRLVPLPESWDKHGQHGDNGAGWYRRHFTVTADDTNKTVFVELGVIADQEWTYIDGELVEESGSGYWSNSARKTRTLQLSGTHATAGDHVIAVRVKSALASGGFIEAATEPALPSALDPGRSAGNLDTGYTVGGVGWYRLRFAVPDKEKQVRVVFDGSYMETTVWINGREVGRHLYGYSPFGFDLTPHLKPPGDNNVLAVRVENSGKNSRWYAGAGLYRPVHLEVTGRLAVAPWGVTVTSSNITPEHATVSVRAEIVNSGVESQTLVRARIVDDRGATIASNESSLFVPTAGAVTSLDIDLPNPRLWSPSSPSMYRAVVTVLPGSTPTDEVAVPFGIRSLAWNAHEGLLLNGKSIKLKGGCIHHDQGPLGAAAFPRAEERRVELLKAAGYNAIRCSHNMPSASFLEACDRLGMLVIDEAFDMWNKPKNPQDYSRFFKEHWREDVEAMLRRDRNHPCVIFWSIGNEIPERGDALGAATAKTLADFIRAKDPTRPVTAAYNEVSESADPFLDALDICGYNYSPDSFERDHVRKPTRVMFTTESYPRDSFKYWSRVERFPYVIGDFIWTAWDYRGESGIGHTMAEGEGGSYLMGWPWNQSNCGDFDSCGFVKPQGLYRQVLWGARPMAILVEDSPVGKERRPDLWGWREESPCWTWPGTEGLERTIRVYAQGEKVRLLLNGSEVGVQDINEEQVALFKTPYKPGTLVAELIKKDGAGSVEQKLMTAGKPELFRLTADRPIFSSARESITYVSVEIVDANKTLVPTNLPITVTVSGAGTLEAFGTGDPTSTRSVKSESQILWKGRGMAIVRANGRSGKVALHVKAPGIPTATMPLKTN